MTLLGLTHGLRETGFLAATCLLTASSREETRFLRQPWQEKQEAIGLYQFELKM